MIFPLNVVLLIFNPIWASLLALVALTLLLGWTGLWARYRYRILATFLALYAADTAIALPRVLFSYGLSKQPVIAQKIPLPRQLVLVDVPCGAKCHEWLISGAVEEVIFVQPRSSRERERPQAVRYIASWSIPGACPYDRQKAIDYPNYELLKTGYCPLVEPVDAPSQGIFLVREATIVLASARARTYTPTHLAKGPPGSMIQFAGVEVQNRSASGVAVLASTYSYQAPGLLGLPPLIGCWDRPDNVIWIMPPGDTGCGFWRWFTWGGDEKGSTNPNWVYDDVFGPPDRAAVPPKKPELSLPLPAEALEILANAQPFDDYLPGLRDQVLDPSNTDQALTEFVARLARRGTLEGSLIALLAANRPATLVGLSRLLNPVPANFAKSGAVLEEMEKDPKFRDEFADTVFLALAARWQTPENIDRFLKLMETSHPGWLCDRLSRFTGPDGILKARENGAMKNYREAMPPFIPLIVEKTAPQCPDATIELLQSLPPTFHPKERAKLALEFCEKLAQDEARAKNDAEQQGAQPGQPVQNPAAFRNEKTREFCRV